jgi:hypothetical protein
MHAQGGVCVCCGRLTRMVGLAWVCCLCQEVSGKASQQGLLSHVLSSGSVASCAWQQSPFCGSLHLKHKAQHRTFAFCGRAMACFVDNLCCLWVVVVVVIVARKGFWIWDLRQGGSFLGSPKVRQIPLCWLLGSTHSRFMCVQIMRTCGYQTRAMCTLFTIPQCRLCSNGLQCSTAAGLVGVQGCMCPGLRKGFTGMHARPLPRDKCAVISGCQREGDMSCCVGHKASKVLGCGPDGCDVCNRRI